MRRRFRQVMVWWGGFALGCSGDPAPVDTETQVVGSDTASSSQTPPTAGSPSTPVGASGPTGGPSATGGSPGTAASAATGAAGSANFPTGGTSPGGRPAATAGSPPASEAGTGGTNDGVPMGPAGGNGAAGGGDGFPFPRGGAPPGNGGAGGEAAGGTANGGAANGGAPSAGAGGSDTGEPVEVDCNAAMPTSGAQQHSGNGTGGDGNLAWEIWSNTGQGELTTYDVPAFSAIWNEAGGYLGRLGFEWNRFGETPQPYTAHGTITAQYVANRSGTAGGYSYIGMYGWTTDPCVEWYVVDDSYNMMPFNPGNTTNMGEVEIDGGTYIMYTRPTTGTGGSRCDGVNEWIQYYSMRRTARNCGQISLTEHFDVWTDLGMEMGALLEAKILVEVGGGSGRVDLPIANVTTTQ